MGSLLGLALGDALGAPLEGGPLERMLWRVIGKTSEGRARWTDDTQMSLDLAESLIARRTLDPDDVARRFATSYRWSRGYGPGAARILKRIRNGTDWRLANTAVYPEGSFGNGAAMRAPVVGLFCANNSQRAGFRIAHYSLQENHLHLLVEAEDKPLLSSGMRGLMVRLARRVNRLLFRKGRFWADRWHGSALTSLRQVASTFTLSSIDLWPHGVLGAR